MAFIFFNFPGFLAALASAGVSWAIISTAVWLGWLSNGSGTIVEFGVVFGQTAALAGLLWDRSDFTGYFRAYMRHFSEFAYHLSGDDRPHWYVPNPARRVLFFGTPLGMYPFIFLLIAAAWTLKNAAMESGFYFSYHATVTRALIEAAGTCALTVLLARLTARGRLVDPPYKLPGPSTYVPPTQEQVASTAADALSGMSAEEDPEPEDR